MPCRTEDRSRAHLSLTIDQVQSTLARRSRHSHLIQRRPPLSNGLTPNLSPPCLLLQGDDRIDPTEWRFLISGMSPGQSQMENPDPSWIETNVWGEIKALCGIEYFEEFATVFSQRTVAWRRLVTKVCLFRQNITKKQHVSSSFCVSAEALQVQSKLDAC